MVTPPETPRPGQPLLTPEFIHRALGFTAAIQRGAHVGVPPFKAVVTDSRKAGPGTLFVALAGDNFDGHSFIDTAIQQGARGVICRRGHAVAPQKDLFVFPVDDTLQAYRRLAAAWRREFALPVVVIAGSVGKTTTKEMLAAILRGKHPEVLRTQGSQNGYVGVPMTLLDLRPEHGAAVIEVGIDEIGAMESHMQVIGAQAALLTTIAAEHLEKLLDLPTVAREEGIALTSVAGTGGLVAINLDDPWVRPHFNTLRSGRRIPYSLEGREAEGVIAGRLSEGGDRLEVRGLSEAPLSLAMPLPGRHNAVNLMAAVTLAHGLGLTPAEIERGLATFSGAEGRSEVRELSGPTPVVCDYYNASPPSMAAGFELLGDIAGRRRSGAKRACLGDMLELGPGEEKFHRELAEPLLKQNFDQILLYGPRMQWLHQELQSRGYSGSLSHHASHETLSQSLLAAARPGDAILIKGSRGMRMETVWALLKAGWKPQ